MAATSVLSPCRPVSVAVTVLTAPVRRAVSVTRSRAGTMSVLWGMVTLSPDRRPERRSARRWPRASGGVSMAS